MDKNENEEVSLAGALLEILRLNLKEEEPIGYYDSIYLDSIKLTKTIEYYDKDKTRVKEEWFEDENGLWQGESKWYYESGILGLYSQWENNNRHGVWKDIDEDGNLDYIGYYWEDEEVSKSEFVFRSKAEGSK